MSKPTITEFLEARIAEDDALARASTPGPWNTMTEETADGENIYYTVEHGTEQICDMTRTSRQGWRDSEHIARHDPARALAECEAKRAIIKQHEEWPVLVERDPSQLESVAEGLDSITYRMTREIAWLTTKEYIKRFGVEPPTAPMILTLAAVYASHTDYDPEWAPHA